MVFRKRGYGMDYEPVRKVLLSLQSTSELERKAEKAKVRANFFTQEELDFHQRKAEILASIFKDVSELFFVRGGKKVTIQIVD